MELYVDLSVVKDTFCQILSGLINYSFYLKCTCSNLCLFQFYYIAGFYIPPFGMGIRPIPVPPGMGMHAWLH